MTQYNNPDTFPDLRFDTLQKHALTWVVELEKKEIHVENISLYPSPHNSSLPHEKRFMLHFDIPQLENPDRGEALVFHKFWSHLADSCFNEIEERRLAEVYKTSPPDRFLSLQWIFTRTHQSSEKGEYISYRNKMKEKCWVLYPSGKDMPEQLPKGTDASILRCAPGTKWNRIKITLLSDDVIKIDTPHLSGRRFHYAELGFKDGRSGGDPSKLWTYLKAFAREHGCISPTSTSDSNAKEKLVVYASKLNKHLQNLFGIKGNIYEEPYKNKHQYKTKIFFSDETQVVDKLSDQRETSEVDQEFEDAQQKVPESKRLEDKKSVYH